MSAPFVGRRNELQVIGAQITAARREQLPAVVLIVGEPGSGKSRLLREVVASADERRTVALAGFEPTEPIALASVGDLIRRLATVPEDGRRLESLAFGPANLHNQGLVAVFEAAHRAHAAFGPLIVAIDDLQWVDAQSLALLHYLVTAAESIRLPLAVLAAARPSPAASSFASGIAGPVPEARRVSIELRGLPRDEGIALVRSIAAELDQDRAEDLWRRAAGSPFWLEALARAGGPADDIDPLADQFRALSIDAAGLLHALAIGARPFAPIEVAAILGWPERRLAQAVRELVGRGLAVQGLGAIWLAHDLVRETAARGIQPTVARNIRARIAETLERLAGDDVQLLAESLGHRAAARLPTIDLAKRLVTSSQRRLLGVDQLRRLSGIADALPAGSSEQIELDVGLGSLANELWERDIASRHWNRVALAAHEQSLRQRAHVEAARAGYESGNPTEVHEHLAAARSIPLDSVTAMELDTIEAQVRMWDESDTRGGVAAAKRALAHVALLSSGPGGLPAPAGAAMLAAVMVAGEAAQRDDRPDDLLRSVEEAIDLASSIGGEARVAAQIHSGFAYLKLGRLPEAAHAYRSALEECERLILPRSRIEAATYLSRTLRLLGRLAEARAVAQEASDLQARLRPWLWGEMGETVLNLIALSLGEVRAVDRIRAHVGGLDPHFAITVRQAIATWFARREGGRRAADVEGELAAARELSQVIGCLACDRELRVVSAELLARIGRVDEAARVLMAWEADFSGPSYPARDLWRARAQASIEIAAGSPTAPVTVERLASALDAAGRQEDAAWARVDLGRALSNAGDRRGAIAAYTAAALSAQRIGAAGLERLAAQALRELGVRAWRRGQAALGEGIRSLSAREREVADLVAGGATNAEVAAALAISPKTVERHLTNILAKLGLRNRTELAAHLGGAGTGFPR